MRLLRQLTRDPGREQSDGNVRARVDKSDDPAVLLTIAVCGTLRTRVWDAKSLAKGQIGAVGARLIPTLDGRGNGIEDDGEVEHARKLEAMGELFANSKTVSLIELLDLFEQERRLREERALYEKRLDILEVVVVGELVDICEKLGLGNADQRIANPVYVSITVNHPRPQRTYSPSTLAVNWVMLALRFCSSLESEARFSICTSVVCLIHCEHSSAK
jgi:hypothetical protein